MRQPADTRSSAKWQPKWSQQVVFRVRVSTLNTHLVVGNNVFTDGLIEQSSIPVLETLWLRNLLFRRMSVKNVVVAFCRRTRPYVNVHETAEQPHRSACYSLWSQTLGWNSQCDTTAATVEWSGWRSRPLWFLCSKNDGVIKTSNAPKGTDIRPIDNDVLNIYPSQKLCKTTEDY